MKLFIFVLLVAILAVYIDAGKIPAINFTGKLELQRFVNAQKCDQNDECIIKAVADYLKRRVNVIDCGFSGVEACKKGSGPCSLDPSPEDPGTIYMCKGVNAVGPEYRGCSLFAAYMGKDLTPAQKADPRCASCKCHTKVPLKSHNQMVASRNFQLTWGPGQSTPANTGTQEEHDLILTGLADYWDSVVGTRRGVCASLAASLAFGSKMMGVKGMIEWVKEAYQTDGHEFVVYNRQGDLTNPTGGKIFDPWYYNLGQHLEADLTNFDSNLYNTKNWNIQSFGNSKRKQKMVLLPLADLRSISSSSSADSVPSEQEEQEEYSSNY